MFVIKQYYSESVKVHCESCYCIVLGFCFFEIVVNLFLEFLGGAEF